MPQKLAFLKQRSFLLGVGAQKAGTTWLYYYLDKHPEVFMSPVKEMHFFGNRNTQGTWPIRAFQKKLTERKKLAKANGTEKEEQFAALRARIRMGSDMSAYRRFFRKRVKKQPVFGEITPAYSSLPIEELKFIRKQFPNTKIIFLMRNPVDRLWSQMRFSEDFDSVDDLEGRINTILERPVYAERINYVRTIGNLREVFAPDQLHFEFYENLFSDAAVARLCRFLQISYKPANFEKKHNVSVKVPLSPLIRPKITASLRAQYDFVQSEFSSELPESWIRDMSEQDSLLEQKVKKSIIPRN